MENTTGQKIGEAVRKAPEWVRHELLAADPALRERAEETLAAMIAAALADVPQPGAALELEGSKAAA